MVRWVDQLPASVAVVDVETTGLDPAHDRIVTIAGIWFASAALADGSFPVSYIHLIFNPRHRNHPRALRVHGYSDWVLKHQEVLSGYYADEIRKFFSSAELIVAHNAAFDLGFVNAELERARRQPLTLPEFCTLEACHSRLPDWDAGLSAICSRLNLARVARTHAALEDAWLATMIYLWLHGCRELQPFDHLARHVEPFNYRAPPRQSADNQPSLDTGVSSARTREEAERLAALITRIKDDKRAGFLDEAECLLLAEVEHQETHARTTGLGVAPWYYEQLAIIYRRQHRYANEKLLLERFGRQPHAPGARTTKLLERLASYSRVQGETAGSKIGL